MKQTAKETMYKRMAEHGAKLNKIFKTGVDNITLCKKLHSLEMQAHIFTTDECNGDKVPKEWETETRKKIIKILGLKPSGNMSPDDCYPVFINGDCRGYALKISDAYIREHDTDINRDWGGYGILAPDFTPDK